MSEPKREVANYEPFYNTAPTAPLVDPPLYSAVVIDDNVEKELPGLCACSKPGYLKWFGLTCCCPMISMYAMSQWFGQARRGYLLLFVLMAILDIIVMPWLYEVRAAQATQGGVIDWMVETEFGIWDNDAVSSSLHYTISKNSMFCTLYSSEFQSRWNWLNLSCSLCWSLLPINKDVNF